MVRRALILVTVLIVLGALLTSVVNRSREADDGGESGGGPGTTTAAERGDDAPPSGEPVRGVLPRDKAVHAKRGQLVELTVTASRPDSATIDRLGLTDAAAPGAPAQFSFLADRAGSFPVRLVLSERRAGSVVVTP